MDLGLQGRVYVVTGGTAGLGYATAQALVADGAKVVIAGRNTAKGEAAAKRLGQAAVSVTADLADEETPSRLIEAARDRFGDFHGALISAGGPAPGRVSEITDDQWRSSFETVFLGAVRAGRVFAEGLAPGGAVAFVLSTSVRSPLSGLSASNGLRPGLAMVAKDLADEYGPRGVRVVGLLPGRINTDRLRDLDGGDPQAIAAQIKKIPLGRYGDPKEFGKVAAFALSPAASYVTGSLVTVDGGTLRTL